MLKSLLFYLRLGLLCLQLFFNLVVFSVAFLLHKLDQRKFLVLFLSALVLINFLVSFYLFRQKNTPILVVKKISEVQNWETTDSPLQKSQVILSQQQLEKEIFSQEKILQNKIKSLGLFLNLSQLNKALGNQEISTEYLQQAAQIEPRLN